MSYIDGHKKSGLKVGDTVRVTRKAKDHERGWDLSWMSMMDKYVRKTGVIFNEDDRDGFAVSFSKENDGYWYPYFVLEKVTPKKRKSTKEKTVIEKYVDDMGGPEAVSSFLRALADWVEGTK